MADEPFEDGFCLQVEKWLDRSRFYRIEFCLLRWGKLKMTCL